MKKPLFIMLVFMFLTGLAGAEPMPRVITLKDGSTIQGKILGMEKGAYLIESAAIGELRVKESEVVLITAPGAAPRENIPPAAESPDLQAVQARMMADPSLMAELQAIASDPEVMALVTDPAFMQAAQARDMAAIQANPRTAQLMNNPKVKALIERMQAVRR
ncbi:MAG: hypothetical protein HQL20_00085 [Candidatus Omnitrophica bacterium]|nr:hypothetical protein [Candidatus Omnitrophota bacterium]